MIDPEETGDFEKDGKDDSTVGAALAVPKNIGRYAIEGILGQGAFGIVYLGRDAQLQRLVAIKVPHSSRFTSADDAEAYLTEARTVASLDHPSIVPVHDVGSAEGFPFFIVSKYIDGIDLASRLKQSRPPLRESVELALIVAEALHHAHKQGLVHRDIKPGNLLLDRDGKPFVSDFGMALREQDVGKGARYAGTPAYMSPEQARGEGHFVDGRSDIYSLGVVLYEMLTGRRPFNAASPRALLEKIVNVEARPPRQIDDRIPRELDRICLKALSKRPSERYSAARDMADDLRQYVDSGQQKAVPSHFISLSAGGLSQQLGLSEQRAKVARSTFFFADFKGFTERVRILEKTAGHQAAAEMKRMVTRYVEEAFRHMASEMKPVDYQLIDTAGDSFFLHFRTAKDAYRLAENLRTLTDAHNSQQPDEFTEHKFRTGAATGDAAWDEGKPVGHVVNVGSRLQSFSTGGDFVVDTATYLALPPEIQNNFGSKEVIRDKNDQVYEVYRTAFDRPSGLILKLNGAAPPPDTQPKEMERLFETPRTGSMIPALSLNQDFVERGRGSGVEESLTAATLESEPIQEGISASKKLIWQSFLVVGLALSIAGIVFTMLFGTAQAGIIDLYDLHPNAEVFVDGKQMTPKWNEGERSAEILVEPGKRNLEVRLDDITAFSATIEIAHGDRIPVATNMRKPTAINIERESAGPLLKHSAETSSKDDGFKLITGQGNWDKWYKLRFDIRSAWSFGETEMSMDYNDQNKYSNNTVWSTKRGDYSDFDFKFDIKVTGSGALFCFRDEPQIVTNNQNYPITKGRGYCLLLLGGVATSQPPWAGRKPGSLYVMGGSPVPYGKIELLSLPISDPWIKTEWNSVEGTVTGNEIYIKLNGQKIIEYKDEKSLFKKGMFSFTPIHHRAKVSVRNFAVRIPTEGTKAWK